MAKTNSSMLPLGTHASLFSLPDATSNKIISLKKNDDYLATVIMFICNHCPYVKHINHELTLLSKKYIDKGIRFIAINPNDYDRYPDDSPENMKKSAEVLGYPFPYLWDESQEVAKAYHATCTPDFFVFNKELVLVYRGQLDDSRPGNDIPVTGKSIREAIECIIANKPIMTEQKPSLGCNIKWKE